MKEYARVVRRCILGSEYCGEVLPDGDDLSRVGPDVPAAVDSRRVFKGPTRAGYHSTGCPYLLRYISTGWRRPQKHKY